jgi:homoserine O-acetyltransferase
MEADPAASTVLHAEAPAVSGDERRFVVPRFQFESGETFTDLRVGYVTHGTLNAARDNAILVSPGTANTRHSADGYIGAGKAFDTDRFFVIAVDGIGAGTSSKPQDGLRGDFPRYTVRDMVRAAHALVTEGLGLTRLAAAAGASMGAFQSLEWGILFPEVPARIVLLVPAAASGNIMRGVVRNMIDAIKMDPDWRDGRYTVPPLRGLEAAGRLYFPWTVADAWLESLPADVLEREIATTVKRAQDWDAWDLIRRYEASAAHDVSAPFGGDLAAALGRVRAPTLVLPSASDRLLGVASARAIARHVANSEYAEIPSERGHLGWRAIEGTPETAFIHQRLSAFLAAAD